MKGGLNIDDLDPKQNVFAAIECRQFDICITELMCIKIEG